MTPFVKLLTIGILTLGLATAMTSPEYSGPEKKLYVSTGQEGTVSGIVNFEGESPKPKKIDTSSDPVCSQANPNLKTEDIVTANGALANVLIFVVNRGLEDYTFEPMLSPATLQHDGCRYVPRVMAIRVGQPLRIFNLDQTQHNTHPAPKVNPEWNQSQGIGAPAIEKAFDRPEVAIPFRDNQHPWEKAWVGVFSHPFFAVSDSSGNYRIEGLPPGTYKVVAWHESLGAKTEEVIVRPRENQVMGFNFAEDDLKRLDKSASVSN